MDLVCSKVNRALNLLRRLSWFLPRSLLLIYLKSYILPHFNYCDVVWSSCIQEESRRLESLLNYSCKIVLRRRRDSFSTAAFQDLGLTTLISRRKLHIAQCMHRCLSSQSPPYLSSPLLPLITTPDPPPLPNLIFLQSGLHLDRGLSVSLVLLYGAVYLQPSIQRRTSTVLQHYTKATSSFILMLE